MRSYPLAIHQVAGIFPRWVAGSCFSAPCLLPLESTSLGVTLFEFTLPKLAVVLALAIAAAFYAGYRLGLRNLAFARSSLELLGEQVVKVRVGQGAQW